jgi:hypothetical protein
MAEQMPASFDDLAPLLIKSFGPPLEATDGNGLTPFFYLPHAHLIAAYGVPRFASGQQLLRPSRSTTKTTALI